MIKESISDTTSALAAHVHDLGHLPPRHLRHQGLHAQSVNNNNNKDNKSTFQTGIRVASPVDGMERAARCLQHRRRPATRRGVRRRPQHARPSDVRSTICLHAALNVNKTINKTQTTVFRSLCLYNTPDSPGDFWLFLFMASKV